MNIRLLAILVLLSLTANAQNAFYQSQYLNKVGIDGIKAILKKETITDPAGQQIPINPTSKGLTPDEISQIENLIEFMDKPFSESFSPIDFDLIKSAVDKQSIYLLNRRKAEVGDLANLEHTAFFAGGGASAALSIIPALISNGLSEDQQTNLIDGLAKYYAEEFKKAQTITYLKVFEETSHKIGELRILFPKTMKKLSYADPSKFPDLGNEYKEIFNEDLRSIIDNLIKYIDEFPTGSIPDRELVLLKARHVSAIKFGKAYPSLKLGADIFSKLINNYDPVDLLNYVDDKYYTSTIAAMDLAKMDVNQKIVFALHGIDILQFNLRDTSTANGSTADRWISFEDLKRLNTANEIKYFLGLIYQQDVTFFKKVFPGIDTDRTKNLTLIKEKILPVLEALLTIQQFRKDFDQEDFKKNLDIYLSHFISFLGKSTILDDATKKSDDFQKFLRISNALTVIYNDVSKADYSNTLFNVILILNEFLSADPAFSNTLAKIEEYGNFMTEVVNAENSEQVKETIRKYAAPPSSFIQKRVFRHTITVTGQPGYFISNEHVNKKNSFVSGITLPMGFEYTRTLKKRRETSASIGVFAQLIDIGAVLNFRINNDSTDLPDKIEFKQFFSPGLAVNYGIRNSPMNISAGYQYTPELREVKVDGFSSFLRANRWFIRVVFDIPLFNVYKYKRQ